MFSTAQNDYLKSLVPVMRQQGYRYYIAYSDNDRDNNYNPDLYVIFAKDKITANSLYSYSVPAGSVRYSIITSNTSYNNTAYRVTTAFVGASTVNIDRYEHIYSNAAPVTDTVQLQPDILYTGEVYARETVSAVGIVLVIGLFVSWFWRFFSR